MRDNPFKGTPVGPDVKKLEESFPDLRPGQIVTFEEIQAAIGPTSATRRRTVVEAWRGRLLDEKNLELDAQRGVGLIVLEDSERINRGTRRFRFGVRGIGRARESLSRVPRERLDDSGQRRLDHARRIVDATGEAAKNAVRDLPPDLKPQARLPRMVMLPKATAP